MTVSPEKIAGLGFDDDAKRELIAKTMRSCEHKAEGHDRLVAEQAAKHLLFHVNEALRSQLSGITDETSSGLSKIVAEAIAADQGEAYAEHKSEYDSYGRVAIKALAEHMPSRQWLRDKIASDPDLETEAGAISGEPNSAQLTVKALEWQDEAGTRFRTVGGLCHYAIARPMNEPTGTRIYRWAREGASWSDVFYDVDACKAAAQADYQRRILSAIEGAHP